MRPTRVRVLLGLGGIAAAAGWVLVEVVRGQSGRVVPVPWSAAMTVWLLAVGVLAWAMLCRPRLLRHEGARPMAPLVAARTAALAMAASRTGALIAGFYAGILVGSLPARETPAGAGAVLGAGVTAVGAIGLAAAALWLEWLCRLPQDPDDAGSSGLGASRLGSGS